MVVPTSLGSHLWCQPGAILNGGGYSAQFTRVCVYCNFCVIAA